MGRNGTGAMRELSHAVHAGVRTSCELAGPVTGAMPYGRSDALPDPCVSATRPCVHGQQWARPSNSERDANCNYFESGHINACNAATPVALFNNWADGPPFTWKRKLYYV